MISVEATITREYDGQMRPEAVLEVEECRGLARHTDVRGRSWIARTLRTSCLVASLSGR